MYSKVSFAMLLMVGARADINEPKNLAIAVKKLNLKHVVITSVNRDDMIDGGANQFLNCINFIRDLSHKH